MPSEFGDAIFPHVPLPKSFLPRWYRRWPKQYNIHQNHPAPPVPAPPARRLVPLGLMLLLSLAINFNQILCTQLYSCLKPSKALLLLRKPLLLFQYARLSCLLPSISLSLSIPSFQFSSALAPGYEHLTPSWSATSLQTHGETLQIEFVVFKVWLSLHQLVTFN